MACDQRYVHFGRLGGAARYAEILMGFPTVVPVPSHYGNKCDRRLIVLAYVPEHLRSCKDEIVKAEVNEACAQLHVPMATIDSAKLPHVSKTKTGSPPCEAPRYAAPNCPRAPTPNTSDNSNFTPIGLASPISLHLTARRCF